MRTLVYKKLTNALAATFNGEPMYIENLAGYSVCANVTSAAALNGTFKLQASNNAMREDQVNEADSTAVWVDIPGSTQTATADGGYFWNVDAAFYRWFRIVWTRTAGTGNVALYYSGKGPQS